MDSGVLRLDLPDHFNGYLVDVGLCHGVIPLAMLQVQGKIFITFILAPSDSPQYLHVFVVLLHYPALLILVIGDKVKGEFFQSFAELNHFLRGFIIMKIAVCDRCGDGVDILECDDVVFRD